MSAGYREFLALPKRDRTDIFQTAANELGTLGSYIEKDFWVSAALGALFNGLPAGHPVLSFKGGTSLSKVFGLIRRFSEDIDITVSRADLGFIGERDPANGGLALSGKKRDALLDDLRAAVSNYARDDLMPALAEVIGQLDGDLRIETDPEDRDDATLLVYYPKLMSEGSPEYVRPNVKIELGARAAQEPYTAGTVSPYVSRLGLEINMAVEGIRTVLAERTFWEKVLILHGWQCRFRDRGASVADKDRASRHYYDVALISQTDTGEKAISDITLLDRVREHNELMFRQGWKRYDQAHPGSFRIVPEDQLLDDIRRDYAKMVDMAHGDAPAFDDVIDQIKRLEERVNAL